MDDDIVDKEERKREYNRLAQREFRRRRKEHLKSLEQAQKEQQSEQSVEIEQLRRQNAELKHENETLKAQLYGLSSGSQLMQPPGVGSSSSSQQLQRSYSASPSIASTMDSIPPIEGSPASSSADILPMAALSMTSSMLGPSMQAYADALPINPLSSHGYSMVHPSGARQNPQSPPQLSRYNTPQNPLAQPYQSLAPSPDLKYENSLSHPQPSNIRLAPTVMVPYNRSKARASLLSIFQPLFIDPTVLLSPAKHLHTLQILAPSLPPVLQPTKSQLSTPHYYGVDLLASPSLRDRLIEAGPDVSQSFCAELDSDDGNEQAHTPSQRPSHLLIWSDDPFDERAWEFSQLFLARWSWLIGQEWVSRAEFWRRQRGLLTSGANIGAVDMPSMMGQNW